MQVGVVYAQEDSICSQSSDLTSSNESFCPQVKIQCTQAESKFPTPHHLITNLAEQLKQHHKRNKYLRARLDTCANVNIMAASVYKAVLQDPDGKKLAPRKLEIGTYMTDTVKLVGSCIFYLVHSDTKCLQEVTFYVASNNGRVLLYCTTTLALGLIQPCSRLDYLPPRASCITSSAHHLERTKSKFNVYVPDKSLQFLQCLTAKVKFPSLLQAKMRSLLLIQMCLMVLYAFQVLHTTSKLIQMSHPSKSLANQSLFI